ILFFYKRMLMTFVFIIYFLLKIDDVQCFRKAGGFAIVSKPPGYATISSVLLIVKKQTPFS
ncbi:MAG: hypothetical protein ACLS76_12110, partial [Eubacterium callanderi]